MFKGSIPALITPFKNGMIDEKAFQNFVEWQISQGSHGLVPVGTTGESPTLSHDEHRRVVELCIEVSNQRIPVIAGAGSNNTTEAVELAQHAEKVGADGVLVVTPYYNKPNQRGLYEHFKAVNDAVGIPIIIYNNTRSVNYLICRLRLWLGYIVSVKILRGSKMLLPICNGLLYSVKLS